MLYAVVTPDHVESVEADQVIVHQGRLTFKDEIGAVVACFNVWEYFIPAPAPDPEDFPFGNPVAFTDFVGLTPHEPLQATEHVDPHGIGLDGICDECDDPFDQENWLPESTVLQLLGRFGLPPWPDGNGGWLGETVDCAPLASEMADAVAAAIAEDLGETCSPDLDTPCIYPEDLDRSIVVLLELLTDDALVTDLVTAITEEIFGRTAPANRY